MANRLELMWYGKDEPIHVEPRLLIENTELSNIGADIDTENMLIHGDNLLALKALEKDYAGQVKWILFCGKSAFWTERSVCTVILYPCVL